MQNTHEKADLQKTKVNTTKTKFVQTEITFMIVKAVGRLLWSGRQTKILQFAKFLKFDNFNSKACLGCLNEFMAPIAMYQ